MKGLTSTAAARAWLGVALLGFVAVVLVLVLSLIPRLGSGQQLIDSASPAFTDERVAGTLAGTKLLSQYVDLADPLLTSRGGADEEVRSLVRLIGRELGVTRVQARKILRREAPHIEALARALPLEGVADEIPRLTAYLATTLALSEDDLAATLEQSFPRTSQMLSTLPSVTDAWNDVPGIQGLTRLSRDKPVRTVPGLRKYLRDDLVPLMVEHKDDVQGLAVAGGIGYIPYLLLIVGLVLFAYGLLQARRAVATAPGILSWSVVVEIGVLLLLLVVAGQYFPRLIGGQQFTAGFEPVFAQERVEGVVTGFETIHAAILFGDPIMTRRGGVSRETRQLYRFVADRTGRKRGEVRRALSRRAPQTVALLDALPVSVAANEVPRLVAYLARALRMPRDKVVALLRRRTPDLARALLVAPDVAKGWNAIPGTRKFTRFDGVTPVRTMPEFDAYMRQDLIPVLANERAHFETLASRWPPLGALAPAVLIGAVLVMLYGATMIPLVAGRD